MSGLIEVVSKYLKPYHFRILVISISIIFIIAAYYGYKNYYVKKNSIFADVANVNTRNKEVIIYMFHVDWCPHCKTALPEWTDFSNKYNGKQINGYILKCVDFNATNDKDPDVKTSLDKYDIESFPTIKMIKEGQVIEFDSKITKNTLDKFVNSMI
jgi:thiol-disulfide isomerase/thioredoxin